MNDSSWSRVLGVLVSPARTFQAIAERPTWVPPLVCALLASLLFSAVATPKLDYGETIRAAVEDRGIEMEESVLEAQVAMMERFGWVFALLGVLIFQPLGFLAIALLFWICFKVLGSEMKFPTAWSVTLHSLMPVAVATVATLPVLLGRDSLTAEELQGGLLLSNLGFLAGEEAAPWLVAALRCVDFFSLWILVLYVIGFRAATRLRPGTVTTTAVLLWLSWCVAKIGFAAISAMFR